MKNRKEELTDLIDENSQQLLNEILDQIIFLEGKLTELKKLPFIMVNPKNSMQQKATPAAKMYKEFLQQYINCIKAVENVIYKDKRIDEEEKEDSPLRKWYKSREKFMDA